MTALAAGEEAGGDIRGQQSAALLVLRRNGGYGSLDDRHVVISIYDHPRPIEELQRCYALHRLSYFPSEPANLVPIGPELALELKGLMARRGFYSGELDDRWDGEIQRRLELFLGSENYDNRIDNGGLVRSGSARGPAPPIRSDRDVMAPRYLLASFRNRSSAGVRAAVCGAIDSTSRSVFMKWGKYVPMDGLPG